MKNIARQCTTLEQSKKLAELGFTILSASLAHHIGVWGQTKNHSWKEMFKKSEIVQPKVLKDNFNIPDIHGIEEHDLSYPCWTIADMMEIINKVKRVYFDRNESLDLCTFVIIENRVIIQSDDDEMQDIIEFVTDNLRDSLFDCLVWLKENKYL